MNWTPAWVSLRIACAATFVCFAVGVPIAWALARRKVPWVEFWTALVSLPLVLPPTVLGYYLLQGIGRRSLIGRALEGVTGQPLVFTWPAAALACAVLGLPLLVRTLQTAFEDVDPELEAAARTLGATEWQTFFTVTLPVSRGGLVAGTTLAFARSMGEFGATLMVAGSIPGETQTVAIAIYDAVQLGNDTEANGLALTATAVTLAATGLVTLCARRRRRK